MEQSIGKKIAYYRKAKGMTQDSLAESLGLTPQAISKWENDQTCPDITLLSPLAKLFGTTVDELLSHKPVQEVRLVPEAERKSIDDLFLRIIIDSHEGDKVRVNLPIALIKLSIEMGMKLPEINGNNSLKDIDFTQIIAFVEKGVMGKLVEIESKDGDMVYILVE
ncbi:MAG: helix-turn-helix transcriptional regulator [Defluviitaleaceae bacterium]|nr:helix-turn-helix transcriptional regulator [Defluviitaleaceae bacterium]